MKLNNKDAEIFIPNGTSEDKAIKKTTHMAIGAHQDDLEIMAYDGILNCFQTEKNSFFGVVVSNGAGSPRSGNYSEYTDLQMQQIRRKEQKKAATIGEYGALALLQYPSSDIKDRDNTKIVEDIMMLIKNASPEVIYTHNLADKHDTHVAVVIKTIKAIRQLSKEARPKKIYGCEVWRGLDWMLDEDKVLFDVDKNSNLASALVEVFDSQISGGKRYDLATMGRRLANATYANSHSTDESQSLIYGMDLTPLIEDDTLCIIDFISNKIDRLKQDIINKMSKSL